jgi:hypothetical protein
MHDEHAKVAAFDESFERDALFVRLHRSVMRRTVQLLVAGWVARGTSRHAARHGSD